MNEKSLGDKLLAFILADLVACEGKPFTNEIREMLQQKIVSFLQENLPAIFKMPKVEVTLSEAGVISYTVTENQ